MSVFNLCETHRQQVPYFSCALVFSRLFCLNMVPYFLYTHKTVLPVHTYVIMEWVVYFLLIAFQVHVFNIPCQDYTFVVRIQGVLFSKYYSKFGQIHLSIEASVAHHI